MKHKRNIVVVAITRCQDCPDDCKERALCGDIPNSCPRVKLIEKPNEEIDYDNLPF